MRNASTHLLFKALGHPLRLALVYFMLRSGPLEKNEAQHKILQILPSATHDQVDRQLRTLERYGIVEKKPRTRKGMPGRTPNVYELTEQSRRFYSRIIACMASRGLADRYTLRHGIEVVNKLKNAETLYYFYTPRQLSEIRKILETTIVIARLSRPLAQRITLPQLDCDDIDTIITHPIFRVLVKKIPTPKLNNMARAVFGDGKTLSHNIEDLCNCATELKCRFQLNEFLQSMFDYLLLVERVPTEALELLLLDTINREP